jgi:hypothetical protein
VRRNAVVPRGATLGRRTGGLAGALTAIAAFACSAGPAADEPAPAGPDEAGEAPAAESVLELGRFLLTRGGDTIVVEEFATGERTARSTMRVAGGPTLRIEARSEADGLVPGADFGLWPPGTGLEPSPALHLEVAIDGAEVTVVRTAADGGRSTERREVAAGTLPWVNPSIVLLELVIRRARSAGEPNVPLYDAVSGGAVTEAVVTVAGGDTLSVRLPDTEFLVRVDRAGRVLGGRVASVGVSIAREGRTAN